MTINRLSSLQFKLNSSLIKIIILEENFKWHLEAFASELFICTHLKMYAVH